MWNLLFTRTPLAFMTASFWTDEGFSFAMASRPILQMIKATAADFTPPFYYLILHMWMNIFGMSEVIMRSLSLLFFVASIYIFHLFIKNILHVPRTRGLVYILLFTINPFLLYFAFEARAYSLFALLTLASFYFFLKKIPRYYIVASVLGLYTHYFFIFVVLTQAIYLFFLKPTRTVVMRHIIFASGFFLPWLVYSIPKMLPNLQATWIPKANTRLLLSLPASILNGYEPYFWDYYDHYILPASFIIVSLLSVVIYKKRRSLDKNGVLFILWAFLFITAAILISFVKPIFVARYLIFAPVGFLVLIVYLSEKLSGRFQIIFLGIFLILSFHGLIYSVVYRTKGDFRKTATIIKVSSRPDDLIYVKNPTDYFTAFYYFGEARVFMYRNQSEVPYYIGRALIPDSKFRVDLPVFPQKAFIIGNKGYEIKSVL